MNSLFELKDGTTYKLQNKTKIAAAIWFLRAYVKDQLDLIKEYSNFQFSNNSFIIGDYVNNENLDKHYLQFGIRSAMVYSNWFEEYSLVKTVKELEDHEFNFKINDMVYIVPLQPTQEITNIVALFTADCEFIDTETRTKKIIKNIVIDRNSIVNKNGDSIGEIIQNMIILNRLKLISIKAFVTYIGISKIQYRKFLLTSKNHGSFVAYAANIAYNFESFFGNRYRLPVQANTKVMVHGIKDDLVFVSIEGIDLNLIKKKIERSGIIYSSFETKIDNKEVDIV